ncbi:hypothetical protein C7B61_17235 [filamentous cyanobacterium CCP1]|nr:hypothetical protein C7B76_29620 [filamentous cyanobacterium CCP2]PSB60570.1 hypothetical protein C7B61_17235 [filamentous cyanobacterium CCP1]
MWGGHLARPVNRVERLFGQSGAIWGDLERSAAMEADILKAEKRTIRLPFGEITTQLLSNTKSTF